MLRHVYRRSLCEHARAVRNQGHPRFQLRRGVTPVFMQSSGWRLGRAVARNGSVRL